MTTIYKLREGQKLRRRVGDLVVTIDLEGVELRGHGMRKRRRFTWEQIASLDHEETLLRVADEAIGRRVLRDMKAETNPATPAEVEAAAAALTENTEALEAEQTDSQGSDSDSKPAHNQPPA